jgi:hypothetical protein
MKKLFENLLKSSKNRIFKTTLKNIEEGQVLQMILEEKLERICQETPKILII